MKTDIPFANATPTTEPKPAEIVGKRGYAARWHVSTRTTDHWIRDGLPHVKIGLRIVRICVAEADRWLIGKYGTRRIGPATK